MHQITTVIAYTKIYALSPERAFIFLKNYIIIIIENKERNVISMYIYKVMYSGIDYESWKNCESGTYRFEVGLIFVNRKEANLTFVQEAMAKRFGNFIFCSFNDFDEEQDNEIEAFSVDDLHITPLACINMTTCMPNVVGFNACYTSKYCERVEIDEPYFMCLGSFRGEGAKEKAKKLYKLIEGEEW